MNSRRLRSRKIISLVEENLSTKGFTTAQKRKNGTGNMKGGRKKNTSQVNTKSVQAMDHEINEEDTTLLTSTPVSAHASVPSTSTDNSLIFANITNISDCNTSVLNKNLDYTVDPSISTNISHVSYSYASLLPNNQENFNPCISSNVSHISDFNEFISTKKLESVPLSENDDNNYSQSMDKRKSTSYFNVSLNDLPDSQMHSFCKLSDILNVSDMLKFSPLKNKSTSFENNFLLNSRNEISDIRTNASNITVIDVPPSVAVKPSAFLNHTSHLDPENVEITSTYLISTVKPPPVASEPLAILDSVSPPNPENIEKKSTYPLSADNFEPLSVATEPPAISDSASRVDAENIEKNSTNPLSTDIVELLPVATKSPGILNHVSTLDPKNTEKNTTYNFNDDTDEPPPIAVESCTLSHLRHLDPTGNTIINKPTYASEVSQKSRLEHPCIMSNDRNQDQYVPLFDNESDFSELSNDKNYEPSSYESSSESDQELLMENECLDGSCKFASSYCYNTSPAEKENVSLREDFVGIDSEEKSEENFNENVDTEKEVPEDKNTSEDNLKGKRIRERDFCFYCETFILNFSRHMVRNHLSEPEVQLALSHPKNSLKRKQFFSDLRKKGNYVSNSQTAFKPVKKCRFSEKADYLPCSRCLGFYSRKQLWRHVKKCNNTISTNNAQVDAQNFLVRYVKVDNNLMKNVFPRMKPDKISLVAKKDKLICMFGAQYLRTHRDDHFATVVSRKMRELAKLLVEINKLNPSINSFEQVLKPQYYDTIVHATKIVARYNEATQKFLAPTYAMNIATSIKQCCSIALLQNSKMENTVHTASIQADLKILSKLIGENWKFDISSQAADDLNVKKWNKTTMVPLAADLKLFKDYLCGMSKQSSDNLTQSEGKANVKAFNNLVETTYCRVLLLNRRRPGELQRLKLNDYNDHGNDSNKYEEFDKILTTTEKILVDKLKRIVIRGKRGRGVPVLFSIEVQDDIKKMLSVRHMYVKDDNNLLFVKAGGTTVCGYKILEKYAKASGAKNYKTLTSTRLRKHLATMTQLFTMTELELEQLATFMGHTLSVHKNNYRLPSDVYQTAKISKLLLLMEDGKADEYQGKTLDEIELNMDEEVIGNEIEKQEVVDMELEEAGPSQNINLNRDEQVASTSQVLTYNTSAKKKRTLVPWTNEQKNVVTKYFKDHIKYKKPPKRAECDQLKNKHPTLLHNKDWLKIKVYIQNIYSKR